MPSRGASRPPTRIGFIVLGLLLGCSRGPAEHLAPSAAAPRTDARSRAPASYDSGPFESTATDAALGTADLETGCGDAGRTLLLVSPAVPVRGEPLRGIAVTERPIRGRLALRGAAKNAQGPLLAETEERVGGPPYSYLLSLREPPAGKGELVLERSAPCGGEMLGKRDFFVVLARGARKPAPKAELWPTRHAFTPAYEDLYSAWIERLFGASPDAQPTWHALGEVLRDPARNFLFEHLALGEDSAEFSVRPDCADLPYFLRAYFAFKLRLPFGFSTCSRIERGPTRCGPVATNEEPFPSEDGGPEAPPEWADPNRPEDSPWSDEAARFHEFLRTTLADAARSAAGRTAPDDAESDFYPVALSRETLRPGVIFADPYGHVLVVASRFEQTPGTGGALFAVDGQPDGTVGFKRFWRGNFLFAIDPALGSAGFKRFRPLVRARTGRLARANNAALVDFSDTDQYSRGVDGFYDAVDQLLSPVPRPPEDVLLETVVALEEQVRARVVSLENGRTFRASGRVATMPDGAHIFETTGDWENYSTPSRDLRLLVAIDVAEGMPAAVTAHPERFAMAGATSNERVRSELQTRLARELSFRSFRYTRTDGSPWELTLNDVFARRKALEVAYDPNDCVELRWGAPPGSEEASTCRDHAPPDQEQKLEAYRSWFRDRLRPIF